MTVTAWVVERAAGAGFPGDPGDVRTFDCATPYVPVAAFPTRAAAEAVAARLEAEARAAFPPPVLVTEDGWTDDVALAIGQAAETVGLPPPDWPGHPWDDIWEFRQWWAAHQADITPDLRAALWQVLDGVRVYRVTEVPLEG